MDEEQHHIDAFETYFILRQAGNTKTNAIDGVVLKHKCSKSSAWSWKKEFEWDEKVAIRAAKINKNIQDKTDSTIEENKVKYLGIVHTSINKYVSDVKKGKREPIEINSTQDLWRLINLGLDLQDEGEGNKPIEVKVGTNESQIPPEVIEAVGDLIIYSKGAGNDRGKCESASTERDSKA